MEDEYKDLEIDITDKLTIRVTEHNGIFDVRRFEAYKKNTYLYSTL